MNEAIDNADTRTDQSDQDEAKDKFVVSDSTDKFTNPRDGTCDPATNIGKHSRDGISSGSSLKNHTFQKNYLIFIKRAISPIMANEKKNPTK